MKKTILALLLLVPLFLTGCSLNDIMSGLVNQVPEAVIDASPREGDAPLTVNFDAHYSHDDKAITDYYWNFGDPHDTVPLSSIEATHTYTLPGTYLVKLTVTDEEGQLNSETIAIVVTNPPPVASFEVSNELPLAGDLVAFDASESYDPNGEVTSYSWNFGDGNTGSGIETSHSYTADKYYVVILTVTDDEGATGTAKRAIIAQFRTDDSCEWTGGDSCSGDGDKPLAVFQPISGLVSSSCSSRIGTVDVPITFDGGFSRAAEGKIVRYKWDFGDESSGLGPIVTHTYQQARYYTVTLTVHDDSGQQASASGPIEIRPNSQ